MHEKGFCYYSASLACREGSDLAKSLPLIRPKEASAFDTKSVKDMFCILLDCFDYFVCRKRMNKMFRIPEKNMIRVYAGPLGRNPPWE